MNTVNLNEKPFNIELCIFCQKGDDLVSTENGRKAIQEASKIRNDRITRIISTIGESIFSYHISNDCYKTYTNKTLLKRIEKKQTNPKNENPSTQYLLILEKVREVISDLLQIQIQMKFCTV